MEMKIGIDSYCYHRYFGEVYPIQTAPDTTMTVDDFLVRAAEMGADRIFELSIETLRKMVAAKDYEYCFSNPAAGTPFESQPRF